MYDLTYCSQNHVNYIMKILKSKSNLYSICKMHNSAKHGLYNAFRFGEFAFDEFGWIGLGCLAI